MVFDVSDALGRVLEKAITTPRSRPTPSSVALDMLMIQGYKSHASARLLLSEALCEDAAMSCRRLLEIAAQIGYIAYAPAPAEADERAINYLSQFWATTPDILSELPESDRARWQAYYDDHKSRIRKGTYWWDGGFRKLFKMVGMEQVHADDFATLSRMAHAHAAGLAIGMEDGELVVREGRTIPWLLHAADRYCLACVYPWNRAFRLIPVEFLDSARRALGIDHSPADHDAGG
jgi:hypothetical protein